VSKEANAVATGSSPPKATITTNPLFHLLIWINLGLCGICLGVMIWLSATTTDPMTQLQQQLYSTCETVFKMTAGAFIGLLGGRAAAPDPKART
jgi:hypothetical protein